MNSRMNSLIWKQWHENKRVALVCLGWMIVAALYAIGYEMGHRLRAPVGHISGLALVYTMFMAVFLAMRTAQGEHTDGTYPFSAALPIALRRIAAVRIWSGAVTLGAPILVAAGLLTAAFCSGLVEQAMPRIFESRIGLPDRPAASLGTALGQLWTVTGVAFLGGLELLLILSLVGCWLRNQAQVGLLGAVMTFASLLAAGVFWYEHRYPLAQQIYGAAFPQSLVIHWGYGGPNGNYVDHEVVPRAWLSMLAAIPVLLLLGALFVRQYGAFRIENAPSARGRFWSSIPALGSVMALRPRTRWGALIRSELCQSLPLAIFGLLFAFLMTIAEVLTETQPGAYSVGTNILMRMPHSTWAVTTLWAVVVGSALYSAELSAGLGAFWRSRPISPRQWFWTKFIVGLVVILAVSDGVTILISWTSPRTSMTTGMSWSYILCMPISHALMYTLAVLGTCWSRKPVLGGFIAIIGYMTLTMALGGFSTARSFEPIHVYNELLSAERAGHLEFTRHGYPLVYGIQLLLILALAAFAYRLAKPLERAKPAYQGQKTGDCSL
jgi:hypothetical protein